MEIDGEPWFVGKDIAAALGYKEPTKAVRERVDLEDRGVSKIDTPSGEQEMTVINEVGVYSVMEEQGLEKCSMLTAIFFDEDFRDYFQRYVDYNLAPENRGW